MKNLKENPLQLMRLKRKNLIEAYLLSLVYNSKVNELEYDFTRSYSLTLKCNSVEKHFPINTPLNYIKAQIEKIISQPDKVYHSDYKRRYGIFHNSAFVN
ncbi:hypothetical protein BH10BAC5_BH10BAC5_08480 [soil metagenome]